MFFYTAPTELHLHAPPAMDGINVVPTEPATLRVSLSAAPEFEMGGSFMFYGTHETHGTHALRTSVIDLLNLSLHAILVV
jgi:hypothetical protein